MKARYEFKFGILEIEYEGEILIGLRVITPTAGTMDSELNNKTEFSDAVMTQIEEYLDGTRTTFDIKFNLIGTEFQKKVWNALLEIPYGETRSYKDIAEMIGNPKASRAVGMANNKNPILLLVPCHRVIGANGSLVGYAAGLDMKKYLLNLENEVYNNNERR